jgi:signal transduction histidine kinase
VVTNLLENAVKYVPDGALVRIRAKAADGTVRLTVEDSGAGVPAAALPRLFEKFFRVTGGASRSRPGTGVGLAVVRGLTEAMNGRVAARQSELGGLAIDVDLPLAPPAPQVPDLPSTTASPGAASDGPTTVPATPVAAGPPGTETPDRPSSG